MARGRLVGINLQLTRRLTVHSSSFSFVTFQSSDGAVSGIELSKVRSVSQWDLPLASPER